MSTCLDVYKYTSAQSLVLDLHTCTCACAGSCCTMHMYNAQCTCTIYMSTCRVLLVHVHLYNVHVHLHTCTCTLVYIYMYTCKHALAGCCCQLSGIDRHIHRWPHCCASTFLSGPETRSTFSRARYPAVNLQISWSWSWSTSRYLTVQNSNSQFRYPAVNLTILLCQEEQPTEPNVYGEDNWTWKQYHMLTEEK